jgi:PTS system ascorbate-specific IIA component
MPVGVLLVSHPGIGSALLSVASQLLRRLPLPVEAFEVGVGVLVLTDLYGATPANVASRLARLGTPVRRVSGLSLPMLLRVLNYAELGLDELPAVAAAGARNGVVLDEL